jgi:hypothetical protein
MTDTIWFELADCIGHALAKRWLARRQGPRASPATEPVIAANAVPEGQGLEDTAVGDGRPHTDSTPSCVNAAVGLPSLPRACLWL